MIYTCIKCNKEFNQKYHYDKHLTRKFPCDKNNTMIINQDILNINCIENTQKIPHK